MRRRRAALAVLAASFAVYIANGRVISAGDSFSTRLLPFSLWRTGSVTLDGVAEEATAIPPGNANTVSYWTWRNPRGRYLSLYPIVTPVLLTPLYAPAALLARAWRWNGWRVTALAIVMEKLAAALVAALSAALMYLLLSDLLAGATALLLTAGYALGTETWAISSQALWQHGMAELLLAALLLLARREWRWRGLLLFGALCGLLAANRPPDAIVSAAFLGLLLVERGAAALPALAGAAAAASPFAAYNLAYFGRLAGGYGVVGIDDPRHPMYGHPLLPGLAGLLASPAKGLFLFSPFLAFLALWLAPARRRSVPLRDRRLAAFLAAAVAAQLFLYAKFDWRGGSCYGPRFLADLMPALVWLLALVARNLAAPACRTLAAGVALSVAVQGIGAFCYPGGRSDDLYNPPGVTHLRIDPAVWKLRDAAPLVEARAGLARPDLFARAIMMGVRRTPAP